MITLEKRGVFGVVIIVSVWLMFTLYPFTPIQNRTVNVTDVWLMNSGIVVWGYWDNTTTEDSEGLFTSGFSNQDIGYTYKIYFRLWPDPDINCLKILKKIKLS